MDNPRNPGLIGRDDVLAQLVRAVEELAGGRGGLVLLTGEAGIGKSAVVAAAATAQGRGARVVWGWGWPGRRSRRTGPGCRSSGRSWPQAVDHHQGSRPAPPRWPGFCPSCRATAEQQALFGALEGRPDEIGRFLGVLTGAVPMADYFRPRSPLRVLGIRGLATMALRGRRPAAVG